MFNIKNYIASFLLIVISASAGYYFGVRGYEVKVGESYKNVEILNKKKDLPDSIDFDKFWVVWDMVNESHISKPLDPTKLLDGAIAGMVGAIGDPYTSYLDISRNKEAKADLNGEYEGIGAQLGFDDNEILIIIAPLDGSPAQSIGLLAGDKILQINGKDTNGISISEAVSKIRGPSGTVVELMLFREGMQEPFTQTITRAKISIESVKWEDKGDGVAYIRLSRFGDTTNKEWQTATSQIKYQMPNLRAIVLDMRNNPGGYLDSSVFISSEFINSGVIVTEKLSNGTTSKFEVNREGMFTDKNIKIYVLINKGSASASEIVTGALKERRDAVVIGQRSYGKGSVQKAEDFRDGSGIHITIAKWLTPDNNWIDRANAKFNESVYNEKDANGDEIVGGIKPDHVVEITDEDVKNSVDPQLDKALELIKSE